jgi:hypothetical protein
MRSMLSRGVLAMLTLASAGYAADPVSRTYDVRDLLISIPDFEKADLIPNDGVAKQPAAPVDPKPQPSREQIVADLLTGVRQMLADVPDVTLTELNGQLTVVAPEAAQARVLKAIESARSQRSRQISIETRLLRIKVAALAARPATLREKLDVTLLKGDFVAILTPDEAAEMIRATQDNRNSTTLTAPRLTLFSGQKAQIGILNRVAFLKRVVPDAVDAPTHVGLLLEHRATLSPDKATAATTFSIDWSELSEDESKILRRLAKGSVVLPIGQTAVVALTEPDAASDSRTFALIKAGVPDAP